MREFGRVNLEEIPVVSQDDPRLHLGLGTAERLDALEVRWPGGVVTNHTDLAVDRSHVLREEDGGS